MGRRSKSAEPYDKQARRSVRQVEMLSRNDTQSAQVSQNQSESVPTVETSRGNKNSTQSTTSSNRSSRNVRQSVQIPSTSSASDNTPSMEQFMLLQNSVVEMKNMMAQLANSNKNVSSEQNNTNVVVNDENISSRNVVHINDRNVDMLNVEQNREQPVNYQNLVSLVGESENIGQREQLQSNDVSGMAQAVNRQVINLMGSGDTDRNIYNDNTIDGMRRVIDNKVSDKIRNQIWANQYVDLSVLIDPKSDISEGLKLVSDGDMLCVAPNKGSKKIQNLGQWCDAFLIYITVYSRKYPAAVPQLNTYLHNMKLLSHKGGDYLYYDEEFRYMRQRNPSLSWEIDSNLRLECRDVRGAASKQNSKPKSNGNFRGQNYAGAKQHPIGYCYKYHTYGKCPNPNQCNYKHLCYITNCGGRHPVSQCPKRFGQNNVKVNSPGTTKSGGNTN